MKYLWTFPLVMMISIVANAINVDSKYELDNGQYSKKVIVQCDNDENQTCEALCGDLKECKKVESYCLNCAGTTWSFLRAMFTQPKKQYFVGAQIFDNNVILGMLKRENFVLVDSQSVFNYYTPIQSQQLVSAMLSYCPESTEKTIFVVSLNAEKIPVKLENVICKKQGEKDLFLSVVKATAEINTDASEIK